MRDPGVRSHGAELQVGALVIVALIALVAGIFWLSNTRLGGPELRLVGVSAQANQITSGAKVFLLGVEVGEVGAVRLEGFRVYLDLALYRELDLPADTRGVIRPAGFLGNQLVDLLPGAVNELLAEGDTIELGGTSDIQTLASDLGDDAGALMERFRDVLSERTVEDVRTSSSAFAGAMTELESLVRAERASLHAMLEGLAATSARLAETAESPETAEAVARLDSITVSLASATAKFDDTSESLASITARLDAGEGSLGKLLADDAFYDRATEALANLQRATEEIGLLAKDIRERPERYLEDIQISVF